MQHLRALKSRDATTRMFAAVDLAQEPDVRAVPALIDALKDWSIQVRVYSAIALGETGDARAVPALIQLSNERSRRCRINAAAALRRIGAPAVLAILEAKQQVASWEEQAVAALSVFGNAETIPALLLTDPRLTPLEKLAALEALWLCYNPSLLGTWNREAELRQYLLRLTREPHQDTALQESAGVVLAAMDQRSDSRHMLRASQASPEDSGDTLLRAARDTASASIAGLLHPSSAPDPPPSRKRTLLQRLFPGSSG